MEQSELEDLRERANRLCSLLSKCDEGLFAYQGMINDAWWEVVNWCDGMALRNRLMYERKYGYTTDAKEALTRLREAMRLIKQTYPSYQPMHTAEDHCKELLEMVGFCLNQLGLFLGED